MSGKKPEKQPSFEDDLARLEALAERMENGGLALDELMNAYEEGAQLAKALSDRLARAKARLYEVKAAKDGTVTAEPSDIAVQGSLLDNLQS